MSQPELVSICLCEKVLQDIFRPDAITLVNVHNSTVSQGFPTLVPILYAYAQLTPSPNPFSFQFTMTDSKGQPMTAPNPGIVEPLYEKNVLHKLLFAFTGLIIPAADTYTISLEIEGKIVGSIPFEVAQAQVEEATTADLQQ